ncbi:MAG: hypothetical protein LBD59_05050 [Prevotellaceae bacterium]|jgi:hypothetical protein|nr:hypothetical protein [Prevotellaceae bacterium]
MKKILFFLTVIASALLFSCTDMYNNINQYAGESVYPAKFDTIIGYVGFERVEIDLMKAGRIPSSQINMGKATGTVVEYDGQKEEYDSVCSWVEIKNLKESKLYRFKVYTVDEYGNHSVEQEIALIPFTASDRDRLGVTAPRVMASPSSAVIDWPTGISSVLLNYEGLIYEYFDKDSTKVTGTKNSNEMRIVVSNTEIGSEVEVKINYIVTPKQSNIPILDTVSLTRTIVFNMPTGETPFSPFEPDVLRANGVTEFTINGVSSLTSLTYPVHARSYQDIFYIPYLREIDLTGGNMFLTPELNYPPYYSGGNRPWTPLLSNVNTIDRSNCQVLIEMLEAGLLDKVTYAPNSIPGMDEILAPYVGTTVELLDLPDEVFITNDFFVDGRVQDGNWEVSYDLAPASYPAGAGLQNVIRVSPVRPSSSFVFALPSDYKYNVKGYPYLKFKVYMPPAADINDYFQVLWTRFMNVGWGQLGSSNYGQEYWAPGYIWMDKFEQWVDITVPVAELLNRHTRLIVINIGYEQGRTPNAGLNYYFANFRLSKTE